MEIMNHFQTRTLVCAITLLAWLASCHPLIAQQKMDRIERERLKSILNIVKNEVKDHYYDPSFHGIDLDARFKKADSRLNEVTTTSQGLSVIAQVLMDFNDSHLFFSPPPTNLEVEYGWRMQAFGDKVFVTVVKPKSDAEVKGLRPGDQIISVNGFKPSRKELWKVDYYYGVLSKRDKMMLSVLSPGVEVPRELEINAQVTRQPQNITFATYFMFEDPYYNEENYKHRVWTLGNVMIWKMPSFALDPPDAEDLLGKTKRDGTLILDLRGNGGGYVKTLERMVGNLFDRDIRIAELKGRKPKDPSIAKTRGKDGFRGKLIVLIDSESGSASEVFARVIQLEKRGTVLGDVSAGAVMQSRHYDGDVGSSTSVPFSVSVTDADLIMADGKSLEHVGVTPDELIVPTAADLAAGRDPVLARALELAGVKLSAEDDAKYHKYYWK
jgi:carboxyl-terminal processing protease